MGGMVFVLLLLEGCYIISSHDAAYSKWGPWQFHQGDFQSPELLFQTA